MKYIVIDTHDNFGIGDTLEEALENHCNQSGEELNISSFEWFEAKPLNVKLVATAITQKQNTNKKETK